MTQIIKINFKSSLLRTIITIFESIIKRINIFTSIRFRI